MSPLSLCIYYYYILVLLMHITHSTRVLVYLIDAFGEKTRFLGMTSCMMFLFILVFSYKLLVSLLHDWLTDTNGHIYSIHDAFYPPRGGAWTETRPLDCLNTLITVIEKVFLKSRDSDVGGRGRRCRKWRPSGRGSLFKGRDPSGDNMLWFYIFIYLFLNKSPIFFFYRTTKS